MIDIKKIIAFTLIMIIVLSVSVFAEPPSTYGPYPTVPSEFTFRLVSKYYNNTLNGVWFIASKYPFEAETQTSGAPVAINQGLNSSTNNVDAVQYYKNDNTGGEWKLNSSISGIGANGPENVVYSNYDLMLDGSNLLHANDEAPAVPSIDDCTIYTLGIGDTINIDNNETTSGFFYLYAHNASFEEIIAIGSDYPIVNTSTNVDSGEWEWMEPEPNSNYNYWKITAGTIEIGIPNNSSLIVKTTTKTPSGGYDVNPSPDRGDYEGGIFGTIAYGIDTLIYWVSYPFVAIGEMFVDLIDEIKLNLGWINDFNSIVSMLFGWIPERFQGLLFICVSATVISFIIRVFRGS